MAFNVCIIAIPLFYSYEAIRPILLLITTSVIHFLIKFSFPPNIEFLNWERERGGWKIEQNNSQRRRSVKEEEKRRNDDGRLMATSFQGTNRKKRVKKSDASRYGCCYDPVSSFPFAVEPWPVVKIPFSRRWRCRLKRNSIFASRFGHRKIRPIKEF